MGIRDWHFENVRRSHQARAQGLMDAQTQQLDQNQAQLMGVMGMNYAPDQTNEAGLTYGGAGTPGGLMAGNLSDPKNWLQASSGIMGIPGMQQMGAQMMQGVMGNQLGQHAQQMQQMQQMQKFQADMAIKKSQLEAADFAAANRIGPYKAEKHAELLGRWGDAYLSETEKLRETLLGANTIYERVKYKGVTDLNTPDILALMSSFVKLQRPSESFMSDDAQSLSQVEGMPGWFYSMAEMLRTKNKLPEHHVAQILRAHSDQYGNRYQQLDDVRGSFIQRAEAQQLEDYQGMMLSPVPMKGQGIQEEAKKWLDQGERNDGGTSPDRAAAIRKQAEEQKKAKQGYFGNLGDAITGN